MRLTRGIGARARRGERQRRLGLASVAALAAVVLIAGCAQIPRASAVKEVGTLSAQNDSLGQVDFLPNEPQKGATQDQILSGFIQAAVSPQGDYQIARDFLSTDFSSKWNPDASVTVDTGSRPTESVSSTEKIVTITPTAFVDADGSYKRAESSTGIQQQYSFVKQSGQWRISKAPNGVIIDSSRFTSVFAPHALYFFSPDLNYLVPDERWFPNSPASLQTRVVKELVQGPASWLGGAYVTAFPQGSQLTSDSVTVTGGQANVDLNSTAGAVDATTFARMQLQLSESLASVAGITDVSISIEGAQRPSPSPLSSPPAQDPSIDSNALVQRAGKFGLLSGSSVAEIPDVSTKVEGLAPLAATLSADHRTAVVLAANASYVVKASADDPVPLDTRGGLIAPTLDPQGYAWSATADGNSDFTVLGPTGSAFPLSVAWPDAQSVIAIAMSRDGTRLAALVRTDGSTDLMVTGVVRTSSGRPESLATPIDLGPVEGGKATSLAWLNDVSVAALTTGPANDSTVNIQTIGGENDVEPGPASGAGIGAVGSSPYYWVLTSNGSLQWPRGTGWQQRIDSVQFVGQQLGKPE